MAIVEIILRKNAYEEMVLEEVIKDTYELMKVFFKYDENMWPRYLPARRKKDVKEFEFNYESFKMLFLKKVYESNGEIRNYGGILSFFSSLNEKNSSALRITEAATNNLFINVLSFRFPSNIDINKEESLKTIDKVFEELAVAFKTHWGFVSVTETFRYWKSPIWDKEKKVPVLMFDQNYIGASLQERMNIQKLESLMKEYPKLEYKDGIIKNPYLQKCDSEFNEVLNKKYCNLFE